MMTALFNTVTNKRIDLSKTRSAIIKTMRIEFYANDLHFVNTHVNQI